MAELELYVPIPIDVSLSQALCICRRCGAAILNREDYRALHDHSHTITSLGDLAVAFDVFSGPEPAGDEERT